MMFPLDKTIVGYTFDSNSFKDIDICSEVEIPVGEHVGAFGKIRKFHTHEGIDLYAIEGDPVFAMEDGRVVSSGWFTGPEANSPWWDSTQYMMVEGRSGVINYGEIFLTTLQEYVLEGELIGHVATVLKKDKGRPVSMLHLELYEHGYHYPVEWGVNTKRPNGLLNPLRLFANDSFS